MKRVKDFFVNLDHRHYVCVVITLAFLCLTAFVYVGSVERLIETIRDFGTSVYYYFINLVTLGNADIVFDPDDVATVIRPSGVIYPVENNFSQFVEDFKLYWNLFADSNTFYGYLATVLQVIIYITMFGYLPVILFFLIKSISKRRFYKPNNDNVDSKPLKLYKSFRARILVPTVRYLRSYAIFFRATKYLSFWLFIWLINTNIASIVTGTVSFLFYFSVSFDVGEIPHQFYKLFLDLSLMFETLPAIVWIVIALILFDMWRKNRGERRLRIFEGRIRGFLSLLPICILLCGAMGKKKTTILTDMALTQRVVFRDKALEIMQNVDLHYPAFPWLTFEKDLRAGFDEGSIYSLATIEEYVIRRCVQSERIINDEGGCRKYVERHNRKHPDKIVSAPYWGYDYKQYRRYYDDKLKISWLERNLVDYAHAYFIYTCSNYSISNYSIRFDDVMLSQGNFPIWNNDFFDRTADDIGLYSRYARILDQDLMRLGKTIVENNPNSGSFEFGVISMTEIGKERLNQLESQGMKKFTDETNQKNDLFNYSVKMFRHPATVAHYPFVRFFCDEQRAMSLPADLRELCSVVDIDDCSEMKIALPLFIEGGVCRWLHEKFLKMYTNFRFYRADNTLFMYFMKSITSAIWNYRERRYNRYGYMKVKLDVEQGNLDGEKKSYLYYLMPKKIYSERFATDCYQDYFRKRARNTGIGLRDYPEYSGVTATAEELKEQHSYFITTLEENVSKEDER